MTLSSAAKEPKPEPSADGAGSAEASPPAAPRIPNATRIDSEDVDQPKGIASVPKTGRGRRSTGSKPPRDWRRGRDAWNLKHDGLCHPALVRLVDWGAVERRDRGFLLPAPDRRGVWLHWIAKTPRLLDDEDFRRYRLIRSALKVDHEPHPEFALRAYAIIVAPHPPSRKNLLHLLGRKTPRGDLQRVKEIVGTGSKSEVPQADATLDDLLAVLPANVRERLAAEFEVRRHPPVHAPASRLAGRVLKLGGEPMKVLGVLRIIADCVARRASRSRRGHVDLLERFDSILPKFQRDVTAVTDVLDGYAAGRLRPTDTEYMRVSHALDYTRTLNAVGKMVRRVLGDDADAVLEMLPARHAGEDAFSSALRKRRKKLVAAGTAKREADVLALVPRFTAIAAATENRVHQSESLLHACLAQLPTAAAKLAAGLTAGFSYTGPVVRADGALGDGEQTVSFRFATEAELYARAHERDPTHANLRKHLPRRGDGAGGFTGFCHQADKWGRLHVVYEDTVPVVAGGEHAEPFFIDDFRWGVLEAARYVDEGVRAERRRRMAALGVHDHVSVDGLLTSPVSRRTMVRYARGSDPLSGDIVVPLVEFHHAMAYARIAVRYGIRWGARFGEIMQIRLGSDCFRRHRVDGRMCPYLAMRPKGWLTEGKFGVDVGTLKAIKAVKVLANHRWHRGLVDDKNTPTLPSVVFGDGDRRLELGEARYIFQARDRALAPSELMTFVRVLLMGVVDMRSHDGRYVFATMMGLGGAGYGTIGRLLHHSPASAMPRKYDLSHLVLAEGAAERFNESCEAGLLGVVTS